VSDTTPWEVRPRKRYLLEEKKRVVVFGSMTDRSGNKRIRKEGIGSRRWEYRYCWTRGMSSALGNRGVGGERGHEPSTRKRKFCARTGDRFCADVERYLLLFPSGGRSLRAVRNTRSEKQTLETGRLCRRTINRGVNVAVWIFPT
jgi:hypothetical protein